MKKAVFPKWQFLSLAGAVLTALTLIFPKIGVLEWVSFSPIFLAFFAISEGETKKKSIYGLGFATVFVYYLCLYHWFFEMYPLDYLGKDSSSSITVILTAWIGLSVIQAFFGGFAFLFSGLLTQTTIVRKGPILKVFLFSALYVIFEWSSTLGWIGVPWGRLCLGQIEYLPVLQSASLLGSYFVDFLILSVNGLMAYAFFADGKRTVCLISAVAICFANITFGWISLHFPQKESTQRFRAAVVQGNLSSSEKWDSDSFVKTVSVYGKLIKDAAVDGADIVLMPETVFPYYLNDNGIVEDCVKSLATENRVDLLVGAFLRSEDEKDYNVLFYVSSDGTVSEQVYAKRHLVPFGEYVPAKRLFEFLIPPLSDLSAWGDDLTPGKGSAIIETSYGRVGGLICFDSIYEKLTEKSVRDGAEWLAVSSNDSWFFDSAAVYQHEAQSLLRAIESGKYAVRSANTGISSVISPKGERLAYIEPLTEGYAVAEIAPISGKTLYGTVGNIFVLICILFAAGICVTGIAGRFQEKRRERSDFFEPDQNGERTQGGIL